MKLAIINDTENSIMNNATGFTPGTEIQLLQLFEGKWRTEGKMQTGDGCEPITISGTDSYEWVAGNLFLLHKVHVMMGDERNETIEVIGFDPSTGKYPIHYFDNKGDMGTMVGIINRGIWTIESESLQFEGGFSEDGCVLSGTWQKRNGDHWESLIDIKLTKEKADS